MMIVFDLFTQLILLLILVQLYKLSKFLTLRIFEMLFDIEHIKIELKYLKNKQLKGGLVLPKSDFQGGNMLLLRFLYWKGIDLKRAIMNKNDKKPHLYGIYGYFGLPGYGKTMAMSWELLELRKKYKDQIYIFTNYGFKEEDKPFTDWRMLLDTYDKPAIFNWKVFKIS